ncbi:MAG: O-methyltransferase [Bacteroidota bacterium]
MTTELIESAIRELETYNKQGESYTNATGRYGWRNPIRADTGDLLRVLTIAANPARVLEMGAGHGLSTLYLASGLASHENCSIDTIEFDPGVAESTQQRMNDCKVPVKVYAGDAIDVIGTLSGHYDIIFFDAQKDKYYDHLKALIDRQLTGPGSIILADNVTDRRVECQPFLDWFVDEGINHFILPTECGLLVARL